MRFSICEFLDKLRNFAPVWHLVQNQKSCNFSIFSNFLCRYDVRTNRPVLTAYMESIRKELHPHYDDVHEKVYQVRDTFKGEIPSKEEFGKIMIQDFDKQSTA